MKEFMRGFIEELTRAKSKKENECTRETGDSVLSSLFELHGWHGSFESVGMAAESMGIWGLFGFCLAGSCLDQATISTTCTQNRAPGRTIWARVKTKQALGAWGLRASTCGRGSERGCGGAVNLGGLWPWPRAWEGLEKARIHRRWRPAWELRGAVVRIR